MNLVFIISHFLRFSKIFFICFSGVFLCDKAHENVRSVQFAVKYCGDMNLCFIFRNRQLSSIHEISQTGDSGNEVRQRASKNLGANPCLAVGLFYTFSFIFLLLWLLKGRKARSYGIFPGNRVGNGIATECATGCPCPDFFRMEAPSVPAPA